MVLKMSFFGLWWIGRERSQEITKSLRENDNITRRPVCIALEVGVAG